MSQTMVSLHKDHTISLVAVEREFQQRLSVLSFFNVHNNCWFLEGLQLLYCHRDLGWSGWSMLYWFFSFTYPANKYVHKVIKRNTRKRVWNLFKVNKIKTPERPHWRCSGVFIGSFEHVLHLSLVFQFLTLNR